MTTTMKLAELERGWGAFDHAMETNGGELTPELAEQLEVLNLAEREKIDGYCWRIKGLLADAKKYGDLKDQLAQRERSALASAEWLKNRARDYLALRGETEIVGETWRLKLVKNGGKPPVEVLVPVEDLPRSLVKISVTPDKDLIRQAIVEGTVSPEIARLGDVGQSLRIL